MDTIKCKKIVSIMRKGYSAHKDKPPSHIKVRRFIAFSYRNVTLLRETLQASYLSVGEKLCIQSKIAALMSLAEKLEKRGSEV